MLHYVPEKMIVDSKLRSLLCCPRCQTPLQWSEESVSCGRCGRAYAVQPGTIPLYDLYEGGKAEMAQRNPAQVWDREEFEKNFQKIGYHESSADFEEQSGVPREVGDFLFERVKGRLLDWIEPSPGCMVLDVGCGAGYFLTLVRAKYLAKSMTPLMAGIEMSTYQLSYMARKLEKEGAFDVVGIKANAEYLPFSDRAFDLVTCSEVLEHIRNPQRALAEMHRVLKPNGLLLLSTPSMTARKGWDTLLAPFVAAAKFATRYKPDPSPRPADAYDEPWYPKELKRALSAARFEVIDFEQNAVVPRYYFKFLPRWMVRPALAVCRFMDRRLKFILKPLAAHFVVRARRAAADTRGPT